MTAPRACVTALVILCTAASAAAQGNGNAFGKNKNVKPPATSTSTSAGASGPSAAGTDEIQIPGSGIRNFGAWLDDASMMTPGQGYVSIGIGMWKMPGYRELDVPTIDTGVGVHRRVQFSGSLPIYHATEPGGPIARGFGTMYLSAKLQLKDPASRRIGFSVSPIVEVLSTAEDGESRIGWALPLNVEVQRPGWRAYGSTGYFSRGALFASGAVEKAISDSTWLTGAISHSYSTSPDPLSFALGLGRMHTDVTGGVAIAVSKKAAAYASVGRTISKQDANAASLIVTAGVSVSYQAK
jgi:hypothetical protein